MEKREKRERVPLDRWLNIAETLFGTDPDQWKFKCPSCGHIQSIAEVKSRHATLGSDDIKGWIYFSCEGRQWVCAGKKPQVGCDWTLGGLFQLHKVEVIKPDGTTTPAMEFAHPDAKKLIQESCPECAQKVCPNESHPGYAT